MRTHQGYRPHENFWATILTSSSEERCVHASYHLAQSRGRTDLRIHKFKSNYSHWPQRNSIKAFFWFKEVISNDHRGKIITTNFKLGIYTCRLCSVSKEWVSWRKGNSNLGWHALFKKSENSHLALPLTKKKHYVAGTYIIHHIQWNESRRVQGTRGPTFCIQSQPHHPHFMYHPNSLVWERGLAEDSACWVASVVSDSL